MNRKFIKSPGLLITSFIASCLLWLFVINVDDPVINKTFSNIQVEILNENEITDDGKCYEVLGASDNISVVVSAKRSVLDSISSDYIRATADMRNRTSFDTLPIEVRVTRYNDRIESVTTRNDSVRLKLENVVEKKIRLMVRPEGEVASGYLLSSVTPKREEVVITGPESQVEEVSHAECIVPIDNLKADESINVPVLLYDGNNAEFDDERVKADISDISVNIVIWATKTIPVAFVPSGSPADGYSATGKVTIEPSSVVITGRSAYLSSMTSIVVPADALSIAGATSDVTAEVELKNYLPDGILFVDEEFDGRAVVTVGIEANDRKTIDVPLSNIAVSNVPEGYKATVVDIGGALQMEVEGKGDTFNRFDGSYALGVIDALTLVPRNMTEDEEIIHTGANDGRVMFQFPNGVSEVSPVYLEVIIERI